jgi:hypothetical protein
LSIFISNNALSLHGLYFPFSLSNAYFHVTSFEFHELQSTVHLDPKHILASYFEFYVVKRVRICIQLKLLEDPFVA